MLSELSSFPNFAAAGARSRFAGDLRLSSRGGGNEKAVNVRLSGARKKVPPTPPPTLSPTTSDDVLLYILGGVGGTLVVLALFAICLASLARAADSRRR